MPSTIPSYVYTLLASIVVGTILISACGLSTLNLRNEVDKQQLLNVVKYVATKSMELTSYASTENVTSTLHLNVPSLIGNQLYWVQIANDSAKAWVEAGFGTAVTSSEHRWNIPSEVSASGIYLSGVGSAVLECYSNDSGIYLNLSGGN